MKLALAGIVVFVAACLLVPQGLRDGSHYSDVHVYSTYAHAMTHGQVPYRDFSDEYPPLAQPVLLAAANVTLFKLVLVACGIGIVWLLATVFASPLAVGVFALSPLLVGSIYLNAYDLWPAFLLTAALALFARQRPMWAFAVLGAATAAKIYPAAVLPVALLFVPRACRLRGLAWFAGVFVLAHLPFLVLGPGGVRFSYSEQLRRGLELNSLGSAFLLITGHRSLANQPPGSLNITGHAATIIGAVSTVLVVCAVLLAAWQYARGRIAFLTACAAAVVGFVAFDKVFSAQYVEWLAPLAPLGGLVASAGTVIVLGLTHAVFSHRSALAEQRDVALLLVRDLSVVALFLLLAIGVRRRPRSGR
ncbi:MAG: hypothetical protein ABUS54_14600 [Actinomycetota bacterium]